MKPVHPLTLAPEALDLLSAALRHMRDAEHLLDAGEHTSFDQAYHLAGFAPECARKATLPVRWLDTVLGHGVSPLAEEIVDLVVAIDPLAARYAPAAYASDSSKLKEWSVNCRYERTGKRLEADARPLCTEAREAVDAVVVALWADGRIPDGETPW